MHAHYDAVSNWLREVESRAQVDSAQPLTPKSEKYVKLVHFVDFHYLTILSMELFDDLNNYKYTLPYV